MRIASSIFLRRAAAMSSSYNRRGSPRPSRGYSSRPWMPHADAGAELVSGDSHLSTVRAANDSIRRGGGTRAPLPPYRHGPQSQAPTYGYGYGQPQQPGPRYGFVPYNYGHSQPPPDHQYGYGTPNQYGHGHPQPYGGVPPNAWFPPQYAGFPPQNAGFRPGTPQLPPRLAEYHRQWRFVQQRPPRQAEKFKVLSYNILADYLAQEHQFLYEHIPSSILDWSWRKDKIVFEFGLWRADILCLQEVDKFAYLEQEMATRGYSGIWKMRTGNAADGCAIFWRTARFQLRYDEDIEFNKVGLRDNVAQLCVLESVIPGSVQTESIDLSASPSHPQQAKQVVICNIHVLYNPKRGDIKLGQVRTLLERAYTISKMWNDAPVILCGDFNSTPKSPLYNFILEQKLNLSRLARNTISGQQTSSSQGLYTGSNISRFHRPFYTTNGREGSINNHKPESVVINLVENACLAGRKPVLLDTASESCFNSESGKSFGNKIPCSGSTNLDEQGLLSCLEGPAKDACSSDAGACVNSTEGEIPAVDNSCKECFRGIKIESREEPDAVDFPSAPTTVYDEILQSDSSETVLSSYGSSRLKDSVELISGSSKDSNAQGGFSGDVIAEDVTCGFEGNSVQPDILLDSSKDSPDEKEKCNESMSGQNNCTASESELSNVGGSLKFADALHQMSNMRLEGENNTGPTHLTSLVKPLHQSDACGNQCIPEVINKYPNEFGNNAHAIEDDATANDILCSDVNSDHSFFKEFSGDNECLHEDEDQLPTTSDGSPSPQQVVTSKERYNYNDPYRWTRDEIKAATGKEECNYVEHNLKVRSVYTDVEDFEGTKDANKEPLVTSYNRKFMGTVDYIWASEDLQTVQVLDTFPKEILKQTIGFPTKKWGSDHIALVCELAFTK